MLDSSSTMEERRPSNQRLTSNLNNQSQQHRQEISYPIILKESFSPQINEVMDSRGYVTDKLQQLRQYPCGYEYIQRQQFPERQNYCCPSEPRLHIYPNNYVKHLNKQKKQPNYINSEIQHQFSMKQYQKQQLVNQVMYSQNHESIDGHSETLSNNYPHQHEHFNISPAVQQIQETCRSVQTEFQIEQKQSPQNKYRSPELSWTNTGSNQQLRSPVAKRIQDAPVILQGWLHKQGSDGLHLWRRRWFVLSEFCLFYYKSQEELKLLGSILLPSYKVSVCLSDDKIYRKYAFKLEHANMRTFILAAESEQAMTQWINSLMLACKLQTIPNYSLSENSLSQIHQNSVQKGETNRFDHPVENKSNREVLLALVHRPANVGMINTSPITVVTQSSQMAEDFPQPLYANAPPKPRRLVDGHQISPSPDMLEMKMNGEFYSYQRNTIPKPETNQCEQQITRLSNYHSQPTIIPNSQHIIIERRTPDTYGRSKSVSSVSRIKPSSSDYEDVYNNVNELYKPPLSPVMYGHIKKVSPVPTMTISKDRPYIPLNMESRRQCTITQPHPHYHYSHMTMRQKPTVAPYVHIVRPHSADFLDYETKHHNMLNDRDSTDPFKQPERPKSSLDVIKRTNGDNYFYSEENYAEKMRQSALYLQRDIPKLVHVKKFPVSNSDWGDGAMIENFQHGFDSVSSSQSSTHLIPENYDSLGAKLHYDKILRSESALSESSIVNMTERDTNRNNSGTHLVSSTPQSCHINDAETCRVTLINQDIRREESMKRLLEWKQRMLQSPLNRKLASRHVGDQSLSQHSNILRRRKPHLNYKSHCDSRDVALQNNSYSSDDEDEFRGRQAGWIDEWQSTVSSISQDLNMSVVTAPSAVAIVDDCNNVLSDEIKKNTKHDWAKNVYDNISHELGDSAKSFKLTQNTLSEKELSIPDKINHLNLCDEEVMPFFFENGAIKMSQEKSSNGENSAETLPIENNEHCNLTSNEQGEIIISISISEVHNSDGSNMENTDHENGRSVNLKVGNDVEERYMIMTPKKMISESVSSSIFESVKFESDESSYVEMTQGAVVSLLDSNPNVSCRDMVSDVQPYEIVCFGEEKVEPVYVELGNVKNDKNSAVNSLQKLDLPDILIASRKHKKGSKSDSSDADDEASKDLDSLDAPCHPRFSLSDTFRPASYYLGASRIPADFHDSSDSELVSPPPIPTSSPVPDDLDTSAQDSDDRTGPNLMSIQRREPESLKKNLFEVQDPFENTGSSSSRSLEIVEDIFYQGDVKNCNSGNDLEDVNGANFTKTLSRQNNVDRLKRRPVSNDFYGKVESLDCHYVNEITKSLGLELYGDDLGSISSKDFSTAAVCSNTESVFSFNVGYPCNFIESVKSRNEDEFREDCPMEHDYENMCVVLWSAENKESNHSSSSSNTLTSSASGSTLIARGVLNQCRMSSSRVSPAHFLHSNVTIDSSRYPYEYHLISGDESSVKIKSVYAPHRCPKDMITNISESVNYYNSYEYDKAAQKDDSHTSEMRNVSLQAAPYYYSDLPIYHCSDEFSHTVTAPKAYLNNERYENSGNKRDIFHIMNPINSKKQIQDQLSENRDKMILESEAKSASLEFLNMNEKSGNIDKRNIYESDSLKRQKSGVDSVNNSELNPEARNLYSSVPVNKTYNNTNSVDTNSIRRCQSLEGLLWNVLNKSLDETINIGNATDNTFKVENKSVHYSENNGDYLWEEDRLWRERLRRVSNRHARSLDDLENFIEDSPNKVLIKSKSNRNKVARSVTYVNDSIVIPFRSKEIISNQNDTYVLLSQNYHLNSDENSDVVKMKQIESEETKEKSTFIIDREKLRQWDLMSSAPVPSNRLLSVANNDEITSASIVDKLTAGGDGDAIQKDDLIDCGLQMNTASGSVSMTGYDIIRPLHSHIWSQKSRQAVASPVHVMNPHVVHYPDVSDSRSSSSPVNYSVSSQREDQSIVSNDDRIMYPSNIRISKNEFTSNDMKLSAGELLGRTHEELVLLLIQLRRQSANLYQAIENCYSEIYLLQSNTIENNMTTRMENLHRLDQLKQHLLDLEKQYEKGKPLVNLVDNMVKLGSLYRQNNQSNHSMEVQSRNRIEFNQHVQERRLLAEERRDWNHIDPDHSQLQSKVQQLYELDGILRRESDTLASLRQDKESLEQALYGLRMKLGGMQVTSPPPAELEWARRHQQLLEQELSRVHLLLAYNSKKLEETVAGNARLEQELIILRQKLQMSRQQKNINFCSNTIPKQHDHIGSGNTIMLEAELRRVQKLVGDLQRQRQELSTQVHRLIDKSHTLVQQIHRPASNKMTPTSPVVNQVGSNTKKKTPTSWLETDLDLGITREHGFENMSTNKLDSNNSSNRIISSPSHYDINQRTLLFSDNSDTLPQQQQFPLQNDDSASVILSSESDTQHINIGFQEKQEIKTVRIVKRESERRQRDRERTGYIGIPIMTTCSNGFGSNSPTLSYSFCNQWDPLEEDPKTELSTIQKSSMLKGLKNNSTMNFYDLSQSPNKYSSAPVNNVSPADNSFLGDCKISTCQSILNSTSQSNSICSTFNDSSKTVSSTKSPVPSPVFKSAAAQQIITEMSNISDKLKTRSIGRRTVPKEKRRHYTAPHNNILTEDENQLVQDGDLFNGTNIEIGRARDDLDMERALRPRINTPDVVRSTLSHKEVKYNEGTIDSVLGTPNKIIIPERYIPEQTPLLSAEEQKQRLQKVESIKKMLSDSVPLTAASLTDISTKDKLTNHGVKHSTILEEKRQREHLLQLNQILAKQVMEMSKIVAGTTNNQRL